ncbi:MAG: 16S rRNA (adenine(1518)-N(6)/adenine(1519)-N(6))-dimethyltransferase RsmA [Polyangia bacterium]|jgi:16S rRNA (adenine1518-N6/adenine1519-N6)-dimethyltransferase|nr:16S rRNA (adenine(1518)-N(6)/adenine(1519)-N(6))-dimethyltransferase RsmA [Polyangia bacterium]
MKKGERVSKLPRARKELGQCFLVNAGVRDKILAALQPVSKDWVVEVGPGPGMLTSALTQMAGRVVAVEIDPGLAESLPSRVARPEVLEVHRQDAASFDYKQVAHRAGGSLLVVGNLPFNAAAPILRNALHQAECIGRLVLMFQKEVADRLVAGPGHPGYGLLSVVTQQRARVERLFAVAPGSFRPAPSVWAGVVSLTPIPTPLPECCLKAHDLLCRQCFAHRRKTLRNNLKNGPWPWDQVSRWLAEEGIREAQRAEELDVPTYLRLARRACPEEHGPSTEKNLA